MTERPDLPDFGAPPVTEVVLGVQFKTEKPLRVPHLGLFWQTIRDDFPEFSEQPPLAPQIEVLDEGMPQADQPGHIRIGMGSPPAPRCWFLDDSGNSLIQVQTDWFLHNWRKVTGDEEYPRFEGIRDQFIERWRAFTAFVGDQGLGKTSVAQADVTYVNHIPRGSCWNDADDMPRVLSVLKVVDDMSLWGPMESVELAIRRRLPDNRGRLHVTAAPALHAKDSSVVIRMVLTARGPIGDDSEKAIVDWMQMGRSEIVKSFTALTTSEAHKVWKRRK